MVDEIPRAELLWTDQFCGMLFDGIESVKWLGIPKDPNGFGSQHERGKAD